VSRFENFVCSAQVFCTALLVLILTVTATLGVIGIVICAIVMAIKVLL
jgi:hypothetical protein